MVNRVVPKGKADEEAVALAGMIAQNAPVAVRESIAVTRSAFDRHDDELFAMGLEAQDRVMRTADFKEGPLAFIEKRPPVWKNM